MGSVYEQVWEFVGRIPRGKILTYGLISHHISGRLSAQGVGWALKALPQIPNKGQYSAANVPWHRVINSQGKLSTHKNPNIPSDMQRKLLENEGIKFDSDDKVDNLKSYLWTDEL